MERILCAAVRRKEPRQCGKCYDEGTNDILNIEIGYRHHDIYTRFPDELRYEEEGDMGFYTSYGRYVDRYEGMEIAYLAGQVSERVALDKSWWEKDFCNSWDADGNLMNGKEYWEKHDTHKYNMLISENLY